MSIIRDYRLEEPGKGSIPVRINIPAGRKPAGIIHFVHGLMESIDDYDDFADYCTGRGYILIRQEIPGHGEAAADGKPGFMGPSPDGWNRAVESVCLTRMLPAIRKEYTDLPYFLAGFSLGSFLVRQALTDFPDSLRPGLAGVCLMGTGNKSFPELKAAGMIAKARVKKYGEDNTDGVIDDLMMDNYNRHFAGENPARWLFASQEKQDAFDPGGYAVTPELFHDFVRNMEYVRKEAGALKEFPLYLMSGSEDPVSGDVQKLAGAFRKLGCRDVTAKSFPGMRHHILRDQGAEEVFRSLTGWCDALEKNAGD